MIARSSLLVLLEQMQVADEEQDEQDEKNDQHHDRTDEVHLTAVDAPVWIVQPDLVAVPEGVA